MGLVVAFFVYLLIRAACIEGLQKFQELEDRVAKLEEELEDRHIEP
jgi:hypothetical protein